MLWWVDLGKEKDFGTGLKTHQTQIHIQGLRLWGRHGVLEEEKRHSQAFEVDVSLTIPKVQQDELSHTVDYRKVIDTVCQLNQSHHFQLIEAFAHELAQAILQQFESVQKITVGIKKHPVFSVGVHLDCVRVEVHAQRETTSTPTSA